MNIAAPKIWRAQSDWTAGSSDGFGKQPIVIKIIPAAVLILLTIVGWITHWTVENAIKVDMASDLETILKADVSALRLWVEDQRLASEQICSDEEIRWGQLCTRSRAAIRGAGRMGCRHSRRSKTESASRTDDAQA